MNGGYLMVSKSDTNLYTKLNNALTVGKPILWYEDANTCYYIDTITKSGTDIILTKGGKTITIASDGTVTSSGDISMHSYVITVNGDTEDSNSWYGTILLLTYDNEITNDNFIDKFKSIATNDSRYPLNAYEVGNGNLFTAIGFYNNVWYCSCNSDSDVAVTFDTVSVDKKF